jgi:hypothetical protein
VTTAKVDDPELRFTSSGVAVANHGLALVVTATPAVARSVGYDVDWASEALDSDPCD